MGVEAFCGSGVLRGSNGRRDSVWAYWPRLAAGGETRIHMAILLSH